MKIIDEYPANLLMDVGYLVKTENYDEVKEHLSYVLSTLSEDERNVIRERYENIKTYEAAGEILGMNRERVRTVESSALRKMRSPQRSYYLFRGEDGWRTYETLKKQAEKKEENIRLLNKELDIEIEKIKAQIQVAKEELQKIASKGLVEEFMRYRGMHRSYPRLR